jgi:hypothetical protein
LCTRVCVCVCECRQLFQTPVPYTVYTISKQLVPR